MSFIHTDQEDFHNIRRKDMLKENPDVRHLMGNKPWTFFFVFFLVVTHIAISLLFVESSFITILLSSFFIGAFFSHALYVLVHETAHNLIFKSELASRFTGLFCDLALVFPGSQAFRKFHILHHTNMGRYFKDADLPSHMEDKWVSNNSLKKFLWMTFLSVSQALRPIRFKETAVDFWSIINLMANLSCCALIIFFFGYKPILYLALSTFIALGPHPLGGRWIAEHFLIDKGQETYSYYGPLNLIMFNIGYHNEHHDFMNIPWINLPKLKKMNPKYYDSLKYHKSYSGIFLKFVFDKNLSLSSRISRS